MKHLLTLLILLLFSCTTFSQGSWYAVPNSPAAVYRFDDISFANDSVGFVCRSFRVHKTADKGNTWNDIAALDSIALYVRSVEFIDENNGFVGILESTFPLSGNLYKTTDGGYTWSLIQNMQIQPLDGICGMAHYGNRLVAVGTYSGPAWFYKTDDLGASWTKVDLSSLASGLVDCYMVSHDTIVVSGIADSSNQLAATILRSVDGGVTWQRVYLGNHYYSFVWKMFFNPGGLAVASVETTTGSPQTIARSTDHGATWSTVNLPSLPTWTDMGAIGMLNDTLGWIGDQGGAGTWETQDGGLTWNTVPSPMIEGDRMVRIDSVTMIAVGATIYKYNYGSVGLASPAATMNESHSLHVFPSPAKDLITIDAVAMTSTAGVIDILDENGSRVVQVARKVFPKGKNSITVDTSRLGSGNYKCVWHNNELMMAKSFVIAR